MSAATLTTQGRCLALFPGAFRPPHAAHLAAVLDLAARPEVDEVVVIVANRSRLIPGTSKALDANVACQIWSIYLRTVPKTRLEIAAHSAIAHALSYFERMKAGDTLLFCIGEADFGRGDERFDELQALATHTGIRAVVVPAPTGALPVRATTLRTLLGKGEAGCQAFMAALPVGLSADECTTVWSLCSNGLREMSEVIKDKVRQSVICPAVSGQETTITAFDCVNPGKADPVFRAQLSTGRVLFVKYAGDTVEAGKIGEPFTPKPRKRLSVERRAINCLRNNQVCWAGACALEIPEVVQFDKETQTLVLSAVCPGGQPLQEQLEAGIFSLKTASEISHFLALAHGMGAQVVPLWGSVEADREHWQRMLALRTIKIAVKPLSQKLQCTLALLQHHSEQASKRGFFHLDLCPKNILVNHTHTGVIDLEFSASVGDPAYDFGLLLGHYLLWGHCHSSGAACAAALGEAIHVYRQTVEDSWLMMEGRVVAFAGATLLDILVRDQRLVIQRCTDRVQTIAMTLLEKGLAGSANTGQIISAVIAG